MKKLLIVVDMQNDFITGSLGTKEAVEIVPKVIKKIKSWCGDIVFTQDTHMDNYLDINEGKHLPVKHCIKSTDGHNIHHDVLDASLDNEYYGIGSVICYLEKYTFGSTALPEIIRGHGYDYIELVGLCTDICVVSNALILKANYPEITICVDASCCAGVTPDSHEAAIKTMKMCQINIINQ